MQQTNTTESASFGPYKVLEIRRKDQRLVTRDFETKSEAERFAIEQTKKGKEVVMIYS